MRQGGIALDYRSDGRLADPGIESGGLQARFEVARIVPKLFDALGLLFEYVEGGQAGGGHCRRVRRRKEERARAGGEELDQVAAAAYIPAQHADRFWRSPHLGGAR